MVIIMIFIFAFDAVNSDLIGFKRLGNNLDSKYRQRTLKSTNSLLAKFVLEDERMSLQEKMKLIRLITKPSGPIITRRSTKWTGRNLSPKKQAVQKFRKNLYYKHIRRYAH